MKDLLQLRPEGLYCAKGDFYIDPWRPVERAVITHGHSDHARAGSGSYLAHPDTIRIMKHRFAGESGAKLDARPLEYGEKIRIGEVELSLHPAGHILGSAQTLVDDGSRRCVFTGDFKLDEDPSCARFEAVECDTFISEATFALPLYHWRPALEVARDIRAWHAKNAESGMNSVLFCYSLGKAQRVMAELARAGLTEEILLHGAAMAITDVYRDAGVVMPPYRKVADGEKPKGRLVIAPPGASGSTWMRRFGEYESAFASGWMQVRGNRRRRGYERGFVVSDHADWKGLIHAIRSSRARRVLLTHGYSDAIVAYLRGLGIEAEALRTEYGSDEEALPAANGKAGANSEDAA